MVGLLDGREEVVADVVTVVLGRADRDLLAVLLDGVAPVVLGRLLVAVARVGAVAPPRRQSVGGRGNGIMLNGNGRCRGQAGGNGEEDGERLHGGGAKVLVRSLVESVILAACNVQVFELFDDIPVPQLPRDSFHFLAGKHGHRGGNFSAKTAPRWLVLPFIVCNLRREYAELFPGGPRTPQVPGSKLGEKLPRVASARG